MSHFLEVEKPRQAAFKQAQIGRYFSPQASKEGVYRGHTYDFCLPLVHAEENLVPEIRQSARDFFKKYTIKWHDGRYGNPSHHMCSSQVCCVNCLFPFAQRPKELATLLRPLFTDLDEMLPFEGEDGQYVSHEWIGLQDYLGEKTSPKQKPVRGALFTSADAAVRFRRQDGTIQFVLIEWKYTESYSRTPFHTGLSGAKRLNTYGQRYQPAIHPLNQDKYSQLADLFYEPFYQLMRQQFLAHEMETHRELGAQTVTVLHIAPAHNTDFAKIIAPTLVQPGMTATGVWSGLVRNTDRFRSVSTESLFGWLTASDQPDMSDWLEYIQLRYPWVRKSAPA